nr:NAD-glutamate dehydrogenase [Streptomyces sp. DSM 41633]
FEHFGLRVASYEVSDAGHCYEFCGLNLPVATLDLIARAYEAAIAGRWQVDRYAALIASAGIDWRRVVLTRAITRFIRQTGLGFSTDYIIDSLLAAPDFVNALLALFDARFDPDGTDHTDRTGDTDRTDRADRADHVDRTDHADRADRADRSGGPGATP